jgi:hypothetical protein
MRLRVRTNVRDFGSGKGRGPRLTGQHLVVETEDGVALDGVQSATIHCGGRAEPVTMVLVVNGVEVDVEGVGLPDGAEAAIRLLNAG